MAVIFLSKEIENEKGYVDEMVEKIMNVPEDETLEIPTTSGGGDIFHADRLYVAIMQHKGHTKFIGIGLAASAAGMLSSAFDEVEFIDGIEFMLHKAHSKSDSVEAQGVITRWNERAYSRMLAKGVNKEFLDKVFLSDNNDDHYLSAKKAEEYGIGRAVKITREDGKPLKVAALFDINKKEDKMFGLKKEKVATLKVIASSDGKQYAFKSTEDMPVKGDVMEVLGSAEVITGKVRFGKFVAEFSEENTVEAIDEMEEGEADQMAELMGRLETLEAAVSKLVGTSDDEEVDAEAKAKEEDEIEAKLEETNKAVEAVQALLKESLEVAATIKGDFQLGKTEDKHEPSFSHLSESQLRAIELRKI